MSKTDQPIPQKKVVDIYCRVSTDEQENNTSLEGQEVEARQFCNDNNLIIGEIHHEIFTGYKYRERKKLDSIRHRYRDGKIQGVVVRTLDRLSRAQSHVAILIEEMEHHNITLYSVKEVIDETPMGKFARMVLSFVAEMEREKILDRTLTGRTNKALQGKLSSGGPKVTYGWQWNNPIEKDFLVHDEEAVKVLRQAAQEYIDGTSFHLIALQLTAERVPRPDGSLGEWYPDTLRRALSDPRMTGKNVQIFNHKNRTAKQHLTPVTLPDGTYPAILSDDIYAKILERMAISAKQSTRNARYPEMYLLRAGFARCSYCNYSITTRSFTDSYGKIRHTYYCGNYHKCKPFAVPADKIDTAVWNALVQLADHTTLLEESIELAMKNRSIDADLRATEATLTEWKAKIVNYEEDLGDPGLRGDTRAGIRTLLNAAYAMVEDLEKERAALVMSSIDRDKERTEYERVLEWCKKVKSEREELSYSKKRDFLRMLGVYVLIDRLKQRGAEPTWDIKVALPAIQEIIYQGNIDAIGQLETNNRKTHSLK
jgi:DNA invertase Pin-like site-specific DNA recombinase